jgi:hypothetical protein
MGRTPVAHSDEQLLSVLAALEECRATLLANNSSETAQLVSVAMLELRMKLNQVSEDELRDLCDEMLADEPMERPMPRRRPLLRLVK